MKLTELFDDLDEQQQRKPSIFDPAWKKNLPASQGNGYGTGWRAGSGGNAAGQKTGSREPPPSNSTQVASAGIPQWQQPAQQQNNQQPKDPPDDGPFPRISTASLILQYQQIYDQNYAKEIKRRATELNDPRAAQAVKDYRIT